MAEIINERYTIQVQHDDIWTSFTKVHATLDEALEFLKDKQSRNHATMRVVRHVEALICVSEWVSEEEGTDGE